MSDWDLSLRLCLPLSQENAAKVLRFVLAEKKGSPLPWRTKTHISSVLQFFFPAPVVKTRPWRIKRMKTCPVMAPHCSCRRYCCAGRVCVCGFSGLKEKKVAFSSCVCCDSILVNAFADCAVCPSELLLNKVEVDVMLCLQVYSNRLPIVFVADVSRLQVQPCFHLQMI